MNEYAGSIQNAERSELEKSPGWIYRLRAGIVGMLVLTAVLLFALAPGQVLGFDMKINRDRPIEMVLIRKLPGNLTGNEALTVSDGSEIRRLVKMLDGTNRSTHACWFHWELWFRQDAMNGSGVYHNEECEEYGIFSFLVHMWLNKYFRRIHQNPSHYLYDMTVRKDIEPTTVISSLEAGNRYVFSFDGAYERFWRIDFETTAPSEKECRDRLNQAMVEIKKCFKVVNAEPPDFRSATLGQTSEFSYGAAVYVESDETPVVHLPPGYDRIQVENITPPQPYVLCLASPTKMESNDMKALVAEHAFIIDIQPYNQ